MVGFLLIGLLVVVVVVVVVEVVAVVEVVLVVVSATGVSTMDVLILGLRLIKLGCSEEASASAKRNPVKVGEVPSNTLIFSPLSYLQCRQNR